ncbi:uncharacterized protein LOC111083213 [Limulus polyphemus]|uniref:Uncharacterized protein LOC111083213 n=1 Tax=Limulus polyphemus TaxID=6850 RepID=A0ABM1RV59_LIMPO|nr:uncharacterized protein LOC111083213 [Limulus polyphemus]
MNRRQNETPFRVPTDGETRIIHIRGRSRSNSNQNNLGRGMSPLHPRPEAERWEYRPRYNGASYRRTEPMPFPLHGVDYRPSRHYPYSRGRGQPPNPAEYRPTGSQPDIVEAYTAL